MNVKTCNICTVEKSLEDFHKNKNDSLGRCNTCRDCRSIKRKEKTYKKKENGEKICPQCNINKPYIDYSKDRSSQDGCQTYCKKCQKVNMNKYYSEMDEHSFIRLIFNDLRGNAKKRNIKVDIVAEDVCELYDKQDGKCALTGIEMTHRRQELGKTRKDRYLYNISIDRIDSRDFYHKNNIQLVCSIVNTIKWDLPLSEFIQICHNVSAKFKTDLKK